MAAAATTSTHSTSKMPSPKDSKRTAPVKPEDPPGTSQDDAGDVKPVTTTAAANSTTQPLAPPPKPSQNNQSDAPDYFNTNHNNSSTFSLEPNPFEQSFGNPSSDTPSRLPPVASITSPSPLPGVTPGWNSLRSGPLSPAMLAGPTGSSDYFSEGFRGGFPTPNESSLRTGLTPGGGGSMFPAPSPNSQALFNLQSGGATPSTLDFHRTAMNAAAASKNNQSQNGATTQAPDQNGSQSMDRGFQNQQAQQQQQQQQSQQQQQQQQSQQQNGTNGTTGGQQRTQQDIFSGHDVSSAANDLLSFASQANGARSQQYGANDANNASLQSQAGQQTQDANIQRRSTKGSVGTSISGSADAADQSESGQSEETKPQSRARNKKSTNAKPAPANRRKADDSVKGPAKKKQKPSISIANDDDDSDSDDMDMMSPKKEDGEPGSNKKMTDEEKRKNFLERNRVAALKCRQRKKQWLANLQAKVELFGTENDALSAQVTQLREEVVNLKTLLLAHKDCPVSQAQGLGGMAMNSFIGDVGHHANPYGMAMGNGMMSMGQQGQLQRS